MIERRMARDIVLAVLAEANKPGPYKSEPTEVVILNQYTLEEDFGWVFFYQSKRYVETGDFSDAVAGNSPIIVNREDGSTYVTGTGRPTEYYIAQYRDRLAQIAISRVETFWDEYKRTGEFGPLRLGMSREQVKAVAGIPEQVGGASRKYGKPSIWKYGRVEFFFRQDKDELRHIYAEDDGLNCILSIHLWDSKGEHAPC